MQRYFAGELSIIDTLPVKTAGTDFQRQVWQELRKIPCGKLFPMGNWQNALIAPRLLGQLAWPMG